MDTAAELTGFDARELRRRIDSGELTLTDGRIPWSDVAAAFMDAWPPDLRDDLVRRVPAFPSLLRTTFAIWRIPAFIVLAMEHQVARLRPVTRESHALSVEQYVAECLRELIDPDTASDLWRSTAFREAFEFPERTDDLPAPTASDGNREDEG